MTDQFDNVFASVPDDIRERLKNHYREIMQNYILRKYEPSELNGGKFCEDVFRLLEWHCSASSVYTPYGKHIKDFKNAVRKHAGDKSLDDAVRFHIPDLLCSIYGIRNKRGVGHSPGDIDPNYMDATLVVSCVDWIMAELVRLFHNVSIDEARDIVQSVTTKRIPIIWEVGNIKRVLSPPERKLSAKEKVLVLLYGEESNMSSALSLRKSIEYRNPTDFRNKVISELHKAELVHFDQSANEVILTSLGIRTVEDEIPLQF